MSRYTAAIKSFYQTIEDREMKRNSYANWILEVLFVLAIALCVMWVPAKADTLVVTYGGTSYNYSGTITAIATAGAEGQAFITSAQHAVNAYVPIFVDGFDKEPGTSSGPWMWGVTGVGGPLLLHGTCQSRVFYYPPDPVVVQLTCSNVYAD